MRSLSRLLQSSGQGSAGRGLLLRFVLWGVAWGCLLSSGPHMQAWAQEAAGGGVATAETPPDDDAENAAESSTPGGAGKSVERLIYIPYTKVTEVLDRLKSKVVLSYEEYLELVKRAGEGEPLAPGEAAVISASRYTAVVKGDVVEITAILDCEVLQDRWAELPVKFGNAAVGEVTGTGAGKVLLRGVGDGQYALLFEAGGKSQVTLKLLAPVKRTPTGPTLDLTIPPVGITTFSLTVPKPDMEISVSPRNLPLPDQEPAEEAVSRVVVSLGATERISAAWVPKTSERPDMDLLTTVSNRLEVSIRDGLVHTHAKLSYQVLRGELSSLRVAVPLDQRILDVSSSARLRGWEAIQEEERQVIEVELLGPVRDALTLELRTEQAAPAETWRLGGLTAAGRAWGVHALDITREQGTLQVTHGEELTLTVQEQSGLLRTESQKQQWEYRYFSPAFVLEVRTEPVQPILDVEQTALFVFREQRLETENRWQFTVRRAGVFHLEFELPENWTLSGVESPQMAEFQHDTRERRLTVVLKERTQGAVPVVIRGHLPMPPREANAETFSLENIPLLRPLHVRQEEGRIGLYSIEAIELLTDEDRIVAAQTIPTSLLPTNIPDAVPRAAWKYQTRPVVIPVRTLRRPTRLTSETSTLLRVEPSGLRVESQVAYRIEYAGIDQFRIAVPAEIAERVQIEVAGPGDTPILQRFLEPADAAGENAAVDSAPPEQDSENNSEENKDHNNGNTPGDAAHTSSPAMRVWRIQTQRPVTGTQRFRLTYDLPVGTSTENETEPLDDDNAAAEPDRRESFAHAITVVRPMGLQHGPRSGPALTRSSGELAVVVDPALSVQVRSLETGLEAIDVRELTLLSRTGQQAFRYGTHTAEQALQVLLTVARFDVQAVASTVVSRMLNEYVLGVSSDLAVRCRMRVISSQRQRLQLRLPAETQPMLVMVNDEIRQLQKGDNDEDDPTGERSYFVNVSRPGDSSEEFLLTIQYLVTQQPLTRKLPRGGLELALPKLLSPEGIPAVVQQTRCAVWLPEEYVPVTVAEPFRPELPPRQPRGRGTASPENASVEKLHAWLGAGFSPGIDFPTQGRVYLYEAFGAKQALELTYWNRNIVLLAFTLMLLAIAFLLLRTSWENKILVTITVVTGLTVLLQIEPTLARQGVYESRYGLLALLAIWGTHGMVVCCRQCCRPVAGFVRREEVSAEAPTTERPPELKDER